MSEKNDKRKSVAGRAAVPGIVAVLIIALLGGGRDRLSSFFPGGGEPAQEAQDVEETVVEASEDRIGGDVTLRLDKTSVYLNEEALVYEEGNLEDLQNVLKEHLEDLLVDDTVLSFDYDDGDYNTYQAVQEVLEQMAVEAVEIHH